MLHHAHWRLLAVSAVLATVGAAAQPVAGSSASAGVSGSGSPQNTAPYRSAFEDYRPFADEKAAPWQQSNDTVRAVGGWRAYAKEANEEPQAPPTPQGSGATPHHGHGKP